MSCVAVFIILTSVSNPLNFNQIFAHPLLSSVSSIGVKTNDARGIEAPSNMNVKSTGIDGGQVKYTVSEADDVGNTINVICNHESGSILSIRMNMVTCNTPRFLEAVEDTTPPIVSVPNDMILEATGPDGRIANYNATATDIVDGILPTSCNPKSGSMFALGQTRVECTANDKAGNIGKTDFVITVEDTTPPTVSVPNDMILEAAGPDGSMASYSATATDIVDGILPTSCNPRSGSMFALGQTRVECTANDKAGNIGKAEFVITVRDTTPPETALGNVTVGWLGSISYGDVTPSVDTNFNFNGTDLVGISYYECRLDNGTWKLRQVISDSSDKKINICTYTAIHDAGTHNFQVRAVDTSGNEDPNPPSFMWDIESPLKAVQGLILQVNNINPTLNLDPLLYQVVSVLSDTSKSNDVSSCYLLDSFMNEIKVQNMIGSLSPSDLNGLARTTLAITDNLSCPPPIANAGSPQSVGAGTTDVLLNGSSSLYADNQASFSWKQIGGNPTVEIKNSESPKATFDAPIASQFSEGEKSTTLTFQLTVVGAGSLESMGITTVKVNSINETTNTSPVAESQSVTTKQDTSVTINLDATDKDGDGLTYSLKSSPSHGSLSSFNEDTGSVVYNPDSDYTGSDSFTFTASDETSTSNTGKVSITVNSAAPEVPTNPPPLPEHPVAPEVPISTPPVAEHHDDNTAFSESKEEMQGEIEVQDELKAESEFEAPGK